MVDKGLQAVNNSIVFRSANLTTGRYLQVHIVPTPVKEMHPTSTLQATTAIGGIPNKDTNHPRHQPCLSLAF
jgi:hypothetical protein